MFMTRYRKENLQLNEKNCFESAVTFVFCTSFVFESPVGVTPELPVTETTNSFDLIVL